MSVITEQSRLAKTYLLYVVPFMFSSSLFSILLTLGVPFAICYFSLENEKLKNKLSYKEKHTQEIKTLKGHFDKVSEEKAHIVRDLKLSMRT